MQKGEISITTVAIIVVLLLAAVLILTLFTPLGPDLRGIADIGISNIWKTGGEADETESGIGSPEGVVCPSDQEGFSCVDAEDSCEGVVEELYSCSESQVCCRME